ncbi:quinone-dependent dihydroorotate dehydrogenase [Patescibacteria group bacterium]
MSQFKSKFFHITYTKILRPIVFKIDPEKTHDIFLKIGSILGKFGITRKICSWAFNNSNPKLSQEIAGIRFKNPVGLSAGFDKNADLINIIPHVGFSFIQIGTVTNEAYEGNPKPRLTRLPKTKGLIVNYGLKNIGIDQILPKVKASRHQEIITSFSVGKTNNKETVDVEAGIKNYIECLKKINISELGDFITINISCPNTFGGEPSTNVERLEKLLKEMQKLNIKKKIFIKMPLDKSWAKFKELLDLCIKYKITGVIIANLAKDYQDETIKEKIPKEIKGGISGLPTQKPSNELISKTYQEFGKELIIIGAGGIFSAEDAYEKIKCGASLVQLITGMIYEGPQLIGQINQKLVAFLKEDGYKNISEAIGANHK